MFGHDVDLVVWCAIQHTAGKHTPERLTSVSVRSAPIWLYQRQEPQGPGRSQNVHGNCRSISIFEVLQDVLSFFFGRNLQDPYHWNIVRVTNSCTLSCELVNAVAERPERVDLVQDQTEDGKTIRLQ